MAGVTHICKRTVVSNKPVEPGKMIATSVLDRLMEHNHLRLVYYYSFPGQWAPGEVTKLLRESCSQLLTSLPIMTGRLVRDIDDQWIVKCNDAGVRMIESRVGGCMEDWLRNVDSQKEFNLIHWEDMYHKPYFWSSFYIQLTEFEKGGVAIGLSCTHLLADHITLTNFIKTWADTTLYDKPCSPLLIQSLPRKVSSHNFNPSSHLIKTYKSYLESSPLPDQEPNFMDIKYATLTLKFTDDMMRVCMTLTMTKTNGTMNLSSSPFEALAALFWVSISKLRAQRQLVNMSICTDARNVLGLQHGFFGNCTVYTKVGKVNMEDTDMLSVARKAVEEAVDEIKQESVMDLIEWLESNRDRSSDMSPASNWTCHDLICAKLDGRDAYSAMFQDGIAPARVSCYLEPPAGAVGHVLVLPAPPGEGALSRVVMVTLPESEAVLLCKQELILRFSPTIVMGVHKNYA